MHKGDGFSANLLEKAYFIAKMSGLTIVRPASSDFWKAPLESMYVQPPVSVPSNIGERASKRNVDEPFGSLSARSPYYAYVSRQGRMTDH